MRGGAQQYWYNREEGLTASVKFSIFRDSFIMKMTILL